ncbi:YeeE/YedE thiosulfate transporter family protein [Zwartia sp.]|uniref:YeeE/YedE thiosulfate transporter family protein n=1 Tax=Zwartia sp. TaxID=2978004 RepID=UPI002716A2C8|nr:YeeE/YedE thiosulfate transporter family protein [Zwartia sp.]MDO9024237.1 YeeE/YedE thiosulfate transporter family protein [Zwartia sp.]
MEQQHLKAQSGGGMTGRWSPYLVGIGIGVLSWVVFVVVAAPIGITTAIGQIAGGVVSPIVGADTVANNAYWRTNMMKLDYGTLFLIGTFFGALASSVLSRTFKLESIPSVWQERFGSSKTRRFVVAFIGGAMAMYGARMAGGCTSGNGISQSLQLAVVGWTFLAVMFVSGALTAAILYRGSRSTTISTNNK